MPKQVPATTDVARFLASLGFEPGDVEPLHGGDWSSAFAFGPRTQRLVARFGLHADDYAKDRLAAHWSSKELTVPAFHALGEVPRHALGPDFGSNGDGCYAITSFVAGTKLDALPPARAWRGCCPRCSRCSVPCARWSPAARASACGRHVATHRR